MILALTAHPAILPAIVGGIILLPELALLVTRHSRPSCATAVDRSSLIYLWGTILTSILVAIPFAYFQFPQSFHFALQVPGLLLTLMTLLIGLVLRCWSIRTLGIFFTVNVASHREHRLVSSGPYAYIRHPSYTGLLLEFLALALTFQNVISFCLILLPTVVVLLNRITIEEQVLENTLGKEYRQYQHQTYALFPFIY